MSDNPNAPDARRPAIISPLPVTDFPRWLLPRIEEVRSRTPRGVIPALLLRPHPRTFKGSLVCVPLDFASELLRADLGPGEGGG